MNTFHRQQIYLVLAAVLLVSIGCNKSLTKTTSVAPIPVPETASEPDKSKASPFRVIGPITIEGTKSLALEIVDESKLSTMSDQPTAEELGSWTEVELPRLELLSIRRANQTGEIVPLNEGKRYLIASEFPELWDANQQSPIRIYQDEPLGAGNVISSIAVSHDDRWFAATDKEGALRIWEIESGALVVKKMISNKKHMAVAVSPDSNELLLTIEDQLAYLLDAKTLDQKKQLGKAQSGLARPYFIGTQLGAIVSQQAQIHDLRSNIPVAEFPTQLSSMVIANRLYFGDRSAYGSWDASTLERKIHWDGQSVDVIANAGNGLAWTHDYGALTLVELESGKILQYIESSSSEKAFVPSIAGLGWLADSKVLVVASSNGLVRVWGTKENGDKLGLKPIPPTIASSSTPSPFPPNLSQLREIIDLRQMPRLPRKGYENINAQFNQHYRTSESIPKCKRFYRHILGSHAWKEVPTADSIRGELVFEKKDYSLAVRLKKLDDNTSEVLIGMTGHLDLRSLPKPEGITIEILEENRNSLTFKTPASRLEIESQLLKQFTSEGWSFVTRTGVTGMPRYSDHSRLNFIRNGISLEAYISPYNASPNERQVRWSAQPKTFWSPIPPGCDCVDVRGGDVRVETSLELSDALSTYDQMLSDDGWRKFESRSRPDGHQTRYFRGELDLLLHFQPTSDKMVVVKQGVHRDDYLPWIDASIEAAAFPIIEPLDSVNFNRSEKWIEYSTRATQETIRETYSDHFSPKGLIAEFRPRDDGAFSLRFLNVKHTAVLTMVLRSEQNVNMVRINGSAIQWNAALPSDPPQLMSFEEWMRGKAYRPSLRHLDDYVREVRNLVSSSSTLHP